MRLDRNINGDGRGKYALINLRKARDKMAEAGEHGGRSTTAVEVQMALDVLEDQGLLTYGDTGAEDEFFVIKLRDRYARAALQSYANSATQDDFDKEYIADIDKLASRAGRFSPFCKDPD